MKTAADVLAEFGVASEANVISRIARQRFGAIREHCGRTRLRVIIAGRVARRICRA